MAIYGYMINFIVHVTHFLHYLIMSRLKSNKDIGFYPIIFNYHTLYVISIFDLLNVKLYYKGDKIVNTHTLWICNHRSKMDAVVLQVFFTSQFIYSVNIARYTVKFIPLIGSLAIKFKNLFIYKDPKQYMKIFKNDVPKLRNYNLSLIIFPEGNTMKPHLYTKSKDYCVKSNLPILNNLLAPREKGLELIQKYETFNKYGNITLQYMNPFVQGNEAHSYLTLFKYFPKEIYITMHYDNFDSKNIHSKFVEKDKFLSLPIDKNTYTQYKMDKSKKIVLYLFFIFFYLTLYYIPYGFSISLVINIFSIIYTTLTCK